MEHKLLIICTILLTLTLAAMPMMITVDGSTAVDSSRSATVETIGLIGSSECSVSFSQPTTFPVGEGPRQVAVADLNGDGNPDIVTAFTGINGDNSGISVLLNDGAGGLVVAPNHGLNDFIQTMAVGEFNSDGNQDVALVVVTNQNTSAMSVLSGDGAGGFTGQSYVILGGDHHRSLAVGDFNADGNQDLVTTHLFSQVVSVMLGDGTGGFSPVTTFGVGGGPSGVHVADFNGDGNEDLATANDGANSVSVLLGVGDGSFGIAANFTVIGPQSIAVSDFNADGHKDIATADRGSSPGNVSVLFGDGGGGFGNTATFAVTTSTWLADGDFNADGNPDLAVAGGSENVGVLIGTGTGSFAPPINFFAGFFLQSIAVGDFNGDGRQDLTTAYDIAIDDEITSRVAVLFGECGTPTPTPTPTPAPTPTPTPIPPPTPTATPTPTPTPAPLVTVGGRVLTAKDKGINRVDVTMTDGINAPRQTSTDQSGNFSFANVAAGRSYTLTASKRGFQFGNGTQTIFVTGDISNLIFHALP